MTTILVIEDETTVLRNVREMLEMEGYAVLTAADGLEGLDVAMRERPDMVICDIVMPLMSGFAVLRELRRHAETADTPVLLITGVYEEATLSAYLTTHRVTCLYKPFRIDQFLSAVHEHLAPGSAA